MDSAAAKKARDWIFQNSIDAVFLTAPDGRILAANPAACRMLGRSEEEICRIGRSGVLDVSDPRLPLALAERERTGQLRVELTFIRADGTRFPGDISSAVFRDSDGNSRTAMIVRDMSEHNRLAQEREQYFRFFMLSADPMCIADPFACFRQVNPAFEELTGYSESELVSKPFLDFVLPEDRQATADEMKLQVAVRPSLHFENRYVCKDGRVVRLSWTAYFDKNDGITYATARDVTQLRQAELRLERFFALTPDLMCVASADGYFLKLNPAWQAMLGYDERELLAMPFIELVHPDDRRATLEAQQRQGAGEAILNFVNRYRCKDGSYRWLEWRTTPALDQAVVFAVARDITERRQMEDQVRQLAFHDALTQLPNRRLLSDRLGQAMAASRRSGCYAAVIFLDLDNFKLLNDRYGHAVGDRLLVEAAGRLKSCVREMDTVARFGGDEFVVMIGELDVDKSASAAQAGSIAEKIRAAMAQPYEFNVGHEGEQETMVEHQCTASIGVALFGKHDASQDDILKWADTAMYRAKESGCNLIRFHA